MGGPCAHWYQARGYWSGGAPSKPALKAPARLLCSQVSFQPPELLA